MTDPRRTIFLVAALVAAADQLSKILAVAMWSDDRSSIGAVDLTVVRNSGGPFGIATGSTLLWTEATAAIVGVAVVAIAGGRLDVRRLGTWAVLAVGAVLGGGIGNLIDRLVRPPGVARGAVIDWISVDGYPRVFNLADVALRLGSAILIWTVVSDSVSNRDRPSEPDPAPMVAAVTTTGEDAADGSNTTMNRTGP